MAITIIKDYSFSFAKNDDYIYLSSDKTDEQQFRYGLHFLYDKVVTSQTSTDNSTIEEGYIVISTTNIETIESYKSDTLVYLDLQGFNPYIPVPILLTDIQTTVNVDEFKLFFNVNKLKNDSKWFYNSLIRDRKTSPFNMYKCITKKAAPNSDDYGVFSVNDITRELIEPNLLEFFNSSDLTIDFYYLPFEEYLVVNEYNYTTISSSTYNKFKVNDSSEFELSFFGGEYVIVEGDGVSFYNGVQTLLSFFGDGSGGYDLTTNKPALKGTSNSGGLMYRADYEATPLTDESLLSSKKTAFYSGLKLKDIAGISNSELNDLTDSYINGNKYFSYSPKEQTTYLNDLGYLTLSNNGDVTVEYKVTDSEGVEHIYDLDFNGGEDVFKVPSNPASINSTAMTTNAARGLPVVQECDRKYEIITASVSDNRVFNIKKTTKFQNVRLLFSDLLGSLNGFNFALYSAKQFKTKKDTFTKDYQDFSNLNTIKFNNQSRGLTDLATFKTYKLVLNSDYLTQEESDYFEDLLSSNNVFAQYNSKVIAVNIPSKSVTIKDKIKGLIRYSLEVEFSISETQW